VRAGAVLSVLALSLAVVLLDRPPALHAQRAAEVWLNIQKGGGARLNIAVPTFNVVSGSDQGGVGRMLADVTGQDLTFTGLFSVLAGTAPLPDNDATALRAALAQFAGAGAHAAVSGTLALRGDRATGETRLYDLTSPEQLVIATKTFEVPAVQVRRMAHKIADEVVRQFTGELGSADTKIAFVRGQGRSKEVYGVDYDGYGEVRLTTNGSINLSPVWSPDARSIAFTSYLKGYPDLYRLFVFERRPLQTLAAFIGINASPAWSPDGRQVALTMSKDGNAEIYVLNVATGAHRRLTRHPGIDTDPSWSPNGRQIAFASDRLGQPNIFVMDDEGANVRPLTSGGFHTQPRWSPRGDQIAFTARRGAHSIWIVNADGSNPRRIDTGGGDAESPSWSPDGRHIAFQSNRSGVWHVYTMHADGSDQRSVAAADATSPSWSPRMP
jgi:TolB protein